MFYSQFSYIKYTIYNFDSKKSEQIEAYNMNQNGNSSKNNHSQ